MRRVAIVTSHFPPSNVVSVHRARLWAEFLPEFGWEPLVVTTRVEEYGSRVDAGLAELVAPGLGVVRSPAIPARALGGVNDLGLRAVPGQLRDLRRLHRERRLDFVLVTIPSNFSAPVGRLFERSSGVPYGIDFQDPWVHEWPGTDRRFSKAWWSLQLARRLEPWCVGGARLVTGISPSYFAAALARTPRFCGVTAAMPFGASERDFVAARGRAGFANGDGLRHWVYAGALLPRACRVVEAFLEGVRLAAARSAAVSDRLRVHFVGTGNPLRGQETVTQIAARLGATRWVIEHPERWNYLDVLSHLASADHVLILGSDEPHYSPSKVYPTLQSRRPVLAALHPASPAGPLLRAHGAHVIDVGSDGRPGPESFARYITDAIERPERDELPPPHPDISARQGARVLADALHRALAQP